jgi:hypothetical protein
MLLRVTPCLEDSGDAAGMRMRSGGRILMVNAVPPRGFLMCPVGSVGLRPTDLSGTTPPYAARRMGHPATHHFVLRFCAAGGHQSVLIAKILIYSATIAAALLFGFWELRLKRQLTDDALHPPARVSDLGIVNDLSERMKREHFLRTLPRQKLRKFKLVVGLKFLFAVLFIIEVIVLQRPT